MLASPVATCPLSPFARSSGGAVRALAASAARQGVGVFRFRYVLDADLGRLRIPGKQSPRQADELWKHTCFEAFVASRGEDYVELNFSPSTEWATYSFTAYRKGMAPLALLSAPRIDVTRSDSQLQIDATLDMSPLWASAAVRVALCAVIEDNSGNLSYWALKHAPDKPDFHHRAGFTLEV